MGIKLVAIIDFNMHSIWFQLAQIRNGRLAAIIYFNIHNSGTTVTVYETLCHYC